MAKEYRTEKARKPVKRDANYKLYKIQDEDVREAVHVAQKTLPNRLRRLRESQNLALSDVAAEIGTTKQCISHYETGEYLPSVPMLVALSAFYGVTLDWLIWDEEARGK